MAEGAVRANHTLYSEYKVKFLSRCGTNLPLGALTTEAIRLQNSDGPGSHTRKITRPDVFQRLRGAQQNVIIMFFHHFLFKCGHRDNKKVHKINEKSFNRTENEVV